MNCPVSSLSPELRPYVHVNSTGSKPWLTELQLVFDGNTCGAIELSTASLEILPGGIILYRDAFTKFVASNYSRIILISISDAIYNVLKYTPDYFESASTEGDSSAVFLFSYDVPPENIAAIVSTSTFVYTTNSEVYFANTPIFRTSDACLSGVDFNSSISAYSVINTSAFGVLAPIISYGSALIYRSTTGPFGPSCYPVATTPNNSQVVIGSDFISIDEAWSITRDSNLGVYVKFVGFIGDLIFRTGIPTDIIPTDTTRPTSRWPLNFNGTQVLYMPSFTHYKKGNNTAQFVKVQAGVRGVNDSESFTSDMATGMSNPGRSASLTL